MSRLIWRRWWRLTITALLLVVAQSAWSQLDATLARAQELVDARQAQAAYELLAAQLDQHAGEVAFDYLFALAALDSGHVSQGVFALERVLSLDPQHPQARAELARAYLLLGELDSARAEFEAVKRTNPPPEVEATIDRYLHEIERRKGGPQDTQVRGFVGFTAGFDSNVNSAQDANLLNVPLFAALSPSGDGSAQISNAGIAQSDTFAQLVGGASVFYRLGPQVALIATGVVSQRWNRHRHEFDPGDARADLGFTWQREQNVFTVAVQGNRFLLDRDQFRDALGLFGQWRRTLDGSTTATAYAQATSLSYDNQRIRNANRYTVGGVFTKALGGPLRTTASFGLYGGLESERASAVKHLGQRFIGATASAQLEFQPKLAGFLNVSVERRDYGGTDPFFLLGRNDTYYQFSGGVAYEFAADWSLIPQIVYSRNASNVALNKYDRHLVSLTVRRSF